MPIANLYILTIKPTVTPRLTYNLHFQPSHDDFFPYPTKHGSDKRDYNIATM